MVKSPVEFSNQGYNKNESEFIPRSRELAKHRPRIGKVMTKNWPSIDQVLAKHWPRIDQVLINYWQVLTKQNNENQAKFYTLVHFESGI